MRTLKIISLFVLCIALIMGCAKDEDLIENQDDLMLKKASKAMVFTVEPTGTDDTQNLKDAFEAAKAEGAGSVVQLCEGEYFIDLIEILEFHGTLRGAGKGKTIITTIADLGVDDFLNANQLPVLLQFVGGDVCVSNLTILTPEGPLSTGMKTWIHGQLGFCAITAQYLAEGEYINAVVENVEFITHGSVRNGIIAESNFWKVDLGTKPLRDIDISVTNCSFTGPYWWYGALMQDIREGKVIAGIRGKGNIFNNCDLGIWHYVSVKASVYGNKFTGTDRWFPLQIVNSTWKTQMPQEQIFQSVSNVEMNTFSMSGTPDVGATGAIIINDFRRREFENEIPMLAQVKSNKIYTEGNMFTGIGCLNLSGAVIRNNKFAGEALFGLRIFPQIAEVNSDNGLVLGNNFSNGEYSETTLLLGEGTSNWTVVGGNLGESVWDFGVNNRISGFNNNTSDVPFGQTIVDNLQEMKSPMHDLMHD